MRATPFYRWIAGLVADTAESDDDEAVSSNGAEDAEEVSVNIASSASKKSILKKVILSL